jgi:N-acetylglutamate synthase-like GNAT family acetyltransferase
MSYSIIGPGGATNNSLRKRARRLATGITDEFFNHEWNRRNQSRNYSVVNTKGKMVAFALIEVKKPTMKIHLIAAKPGLGIGKLLMQKIITNAKRRRLQVIFFDSVPSAVGFYKKLGFVPVPNQKHNTLTMMAKNIRPVKRVVKTKKSPSNLNRFLKASSAVSNAFKQPVNTKKNNLARFLRAASAASNSFRM